MKNTISATALTCSILSLALLLAYTLGGWGQTKIGIVRSGVLMEEAQILIDARLRQEDKQKVWEGNIKSLEQDIESSVEQYQKEAAAMNREERSVLEQKLERQRDSYIQYVKTVGTRAVEEQQEALSIALGRVNAFIQDYAAQEGYDIILGTTTEGSVLYGVDAVDITREILDALNADYTGGK